MSDSDLLDQLSQRLPSKLMDRVSAALAASQPVGNYEVQTENGPLKCSLAVYAEWQKNEEYIERLKAELAARQPVDLGELREAIRKAWQKSAAGENIDLLFGSLLALIDSYPKEPIS